MPRKEFLALLILLVGLSGQLRGQDAAALRAPAVPLIPVDPYFSVWATADRLTDNQPDGKPGIAHWTGAANPLTSLVNVDGKTYRVMGTAPAEVPAMDQKSLSIQPTTVTYTFEGAGIRVALEFMTPLLPEDLMVMSRPITYLTWNVNSIDGKEHEVKVYFDDTADLVVNDAKKEKVTWSTDEFGNVDAVKVGSVDQPVLKLKGDRVRINWGYTYVAAPHSENPKFVIGSAEKTRNAWGDGSAATTDTTPVAASEAPVLSATLGLGTVGTQPVCTYVMLAYDDVYSAQYFYKNLKGYWTKDGAKIGDILQAAAKDYVPLKARCHAFDAEMMADLKKAGGDRYAWIGALAYRQSLAASKVVADANGNPLFFCKENTSNGCMGTVDVFYPQAPLLLFISPTLSKAMLIPVLDYASTPAWKWPNAPHDVGTWPRADGQVYGGTKSNGGMPVEETGNMILLVAAVAQVDGNADFAGKYWPTLSKWAQYLEQFGRDPENQLCTDDFAGHLAHNSNLAGKAICALGAYGKLARMRGDDATAEKYTKMAREYALGWVKQADDGDHFRLAFDQANTWSSKYNLVWDAILDLNLFPKEAMEKEMAFYRSHIDKYGLALDGRAQRAGTRAEPRQARWSKTDWAFWTACLTNNQADFDAITDPVYKFFNEAQQRVGLTDLYFTDRPDAARMYARPVIGGLFIKMLYDKDVWKKWAARDKSKPTGPWAPFPNPPETKNVVAPSDVQWSFTTKEPADDWYRADFDDSSWQKSRGAFEKDNAAWKSGDIWMRAHVTLPKEQSNELQMTLLHSGPAQFFLNGATLASPRSGEEGFVQYGFNRRATLHPGDNLIAIHCTAEGNSAQAGAGIVDLVAN